MNDSKIIGMISGISTETVNTAIENLVIGQVDLTSYEKTIDVDTKLNTKASKNGNIAENFSSNNITVQGDILPTTNGTQSIGSPTNRFKEIYVDEAKLSVNTLYLGDTPVMGTSGDNIIIRGDLDQHITMKTSGVGSTKVISENGVELSTSGMNANVNVQATGSGANANIGATNQINLIAPTINVQGTSTDIKGATAVDSLTIRGNVTINGGATTIQSTTVQVEDNIMELNKGEVGYGVTAGRSGLKIDRGDADDYLIIFDETDDSLKMGTDTALQKVASENYVDSKDALKSDKIHYHNVSDITNLQTNLDSKISNTTTVNGKTLNSNITLSKSDIGLSNVQNIDTTNASNITSGKLPSAQLPIASNTSVGGVKAGTNITIASDGTISSTASGSGVIARNVSNLRGTVSEGATNILLQWTNPNPIMPTDFQKREIYVNDSDLVNMDRDYWKANATLLNDTIGTGINAVDSYTYTIPSNQLGKTLYFRSFCLYDFGTPTWSGGTGITLVAVDNVAPNKIEGLTAIQNKDSITVSWTSNPTDSDLAGILVKMNDTIQYPTDRFSGMTVFDGKLKSFTLNNLDKSKTYSFRLFTYDTSGNYNNDASMEIQVIMDNTPPLAVQNLTSTNGHQFIKLRWDETNCGTDWVKTYIVQKMGNVSSFNISDGTLVLTNQIKDTYKTNWFIVSGLTNSQPYTFTFFVEDVNGNIGNPISITDTPTASALPTPVAFTTDMNGTVQTEIKVSWINPFSSDYSGRVLYHSLSDLSGKTKTELDDMVTNSQATILNQGVGTGSGANDQYINNGITSGVTNYYAMVTKYNIGGTDYYSAVVDDNATTSDIVPPANVTSLQVVGGDGTLSISYTDPSDLDFDKTIIMVTKGSFQNYNYIGADLIYTEEATKDKYKTTPLVLTSANGIVNNTTYYVWVYPRDITGNKNTNVANRSSALPQPLPIYGIQYDSSNRTWTRLGLASSMNSTDFNTISPYKDIKRVLLTDAKAKTYLKSTDSTLKEDGTSATLDGTLGNVFSEFPKLFYKYENSGTIHKWYISNSAVGGCTPHKAFIRNSVTKDYLYMGCYKGYVNGTKLESRSGILPTTSGKSFSDFRTLAEARGTGFTQFDSLSLHLLQILFLVQFGHADFSNVLNSGQDIGTILTSGGSNSLGNATGVIGNYSSLYGLESLVGGSHSVIDGLIAGSKYWQSNNSFGSMTSESSSGTYSQLSTTTPSSVNGFISNIEPLDSVIIGKTMEGSSSDGFNDYQVSKNGSNLNVMVLGGSPLASQRGLFNNEFVDVTNMSTTTNMTSETSIDKYSVWSYSLDRSIFGIKSVSSYSLVDSATPTITSNLAIQNLSGRLISY